jgi:hypothetical protein
MGRWLTIGQADKRNGKNMAYGRKERRKYRKGCRKERMRAKHEFICG